MRGREVSPGPSRMTTPAVQWVSKNLRGLLDGVLDFFLPASCAACSEIIGSTVRASSASPRVCTGCWNSIQMLRPPFCPRCGEPFASDYALSDSPGHLCGKCREKEPWFDSARAAGLYEGALRAIIHSYKYDAMSGLSGALTDLLNERFKEGFGGETFDWVTHVPLHPRRYRERGFDQSWFLARRLGRAEGVTAKPYLLERVRWNAAQSNLTEPQRRANVRNAFVVRDPQSVTGRRVLLVDDVLTTGSTADECARVLKKAGAESVHVYTVARTA